jgi:[ribosomal protein S5]-alanine N-acetyltransferase
MSAVEIHAWPDDAGEGLATPRLQLRRFTRADEDLLWQLNSDARVMRYLGGTLSPGKNRELLEQRILAYYDEHPGLGVWATLERASGHCIGFHLLNHVQGQTEVIQVGYRLFPEAWGRGYATEMTRALLAYGFQRRRLPLLTANADPGNLASHRVLLKSGLQRRGERAWPGPSYAGLGPIPYFERAAQAWLSEHRLSGIDTEGGST